MLSADRDGRVTKTNQSVTEALEVVGYVRVSTLDQLESGAGLEAQRQAIRLEADRRGWRLLAIHEDAASGKSLATREGLAEALETLDAGEAAALVVAKLDRLSRSLQDFAALMDRSRRRGWSLVALDLGVDTTTPQGEMLANVMATFAQFERRIIGQRTKDALAVKRLQGVRLGRPPALPKALQTRVRRLRSRGWSLREIAELLNKESVPTAANGTCWYPATVARLLRPAEAAA